jgi:GTP cyclohydrolase II
MKTAARASLPTRYGTFEMSVYGAPEREEHVALTVGAIDDGEQGSGYSTAGSSIRA